LPLTRIGQLGFCQLEITVFNAATARMSVQKPLAGRGGHVNSPTAIAVWLPNAARRARSPRAKVSVDDLTASGIFAIKGE
jgi:hypothetical protein